MVNWHNKTLKYTYLYMVCRWDVGSGWSSGGGSSGGRLTLNLFDCGGGAAVTGCDAVSALTRYCNSVGFRWGVGGNVSWSVCGDISACGFLN